MKTERKHSLAKAGYTIGSTDDFLELTDAESAMVALRARLAGEVRKRRLRRRFSQVELAHLLQSSQSRVAKIEAGETSVSIDLLFRALLATGVRMPEVGKIVAAS
jgi:ribosome-binding protein aMBF1 (putative translation factor)